MTTTTNPIWIAEKIDRSGARHVVKPGFGMNVVSLCTGRMLREMVPVSGAPVTCKACVKKAASLGIDTREL